MFKLLPFRLRALVLFIVVLFSAIRSQATHIFGVDLYYTHVTGNTYTVNLVMYGDCSGAAFGSLPTSVPVVNVYNGNTFISALSLILQPPTTGVEVTPVCPADVGHTTCTNLSYTIPGVKKFVYSANVTLSGTSTVWRFLFQGVMGSGGSAGRSSGITNILTPGSTLIQLVDTLNNTTFDNSSAVYTTIPTPFFCLSVPANFNPGAVDPDGDSLTFHLVPGVDGSTGANVTYILPYTATAPLATAPGSFTFSNSTGQLSFTPNALQKSLVVYNVREFNAGVLRGTSQREMTVVVISCTNTPPTGVISSPTAGTVTSPTTIDICANAGPFSFHINPTDPDGNNITMTVSGLPAGATFNIVGNGTLSPIGTFSWNTTGVTPGAYIFYVNYRDDACPLSGTQTIAYTINVLPIPTESVTLVSAATCTRRAVFHVTPGGSTSPWTIRVIQSGVTIQTFSGVTGMITDSLLPGTYTIRISNPSNCFVDTVVTFAAPALPVPAVTVTAPLCAGGSTGTATISATGGLPPYLYALGSGSYGSSGLFTGLPAGICTLHVKDANDCVKDTIVTIPAAPPILVTLIKRRPTCDTFTNGSVIILAYNTVGPYTYALGSGPFTSNDTFSHLGTGSYTFHVKDANGCILDTVVALTDSVSIHGLLSVTGILCNGGTATVTVIATGGFGPPYTYAYNTNPYGTSSVFTVPAGGYTFHVRDSNNCAFDTTITIIQPPPITITHVLTNIACNGGSTGVIVVNAVGGTPGYQYSLDGGAYVLSNTFTGLPAGTHIARVQDVNGCVYADTSVLTQPTSVAVDSVVMVKPACNGLANGSIRVYASGGVSPYTYAINTSAYVAGSTFPGLAAGTYTMHIKDANGCIKDTIVTLQQPSPIVPAAIVKKSLCATLSNGMVTLSATGGTPSYTFAVGSGAFSSTPVFTPLGAAVYTFHIKDANGCVKDTIITVTDSMRVSGLFTITPALCYNQASGSIDVTGIGGITPYRYAMGSGTPGTAHLFGGLLAGTYMIHIQDSNGCRNDSLITVTEPTPVVPSVTITSPTCNGYTDGSVTVAASGGTPSYTYSFNGGSYSGVTVFPGLPAGTDSVRIKDANGCLHDTVFTITEPTRLTISDMTLKNISCFNGGDGSISVSGMGATPPYMYAMNAGAWQAGGLFTGLAASTVTVKLKDNNGCELDTMVVLTQPPVLEITGVDTLNPTCEGFKDGAVTVRVAGGTPLYTYSDDNTNYVASGVFKDLGEGSYLFSVKDANGCRADTPITLTGLPHIIINTADLTQPMCVGANNGSIIVTASGGVPDLKYYMGGNATALATGIFKNLITGTYVIKVKDSKNCEKDTTLFLPQPDSLHITTVVTPNECLGEDNKGGVSVNVTGGTAPYSYLWTTTNQTTAQIAGLPNGKYTVWVKDANNCTDSLTSEVVYDNCCTPYIPNAFTPNGDGKNDLFKILFKGDMYIIVFSIYNRFGQRVYSISNTNDQSLGWDGKLDGVDAELGTYFYYAKIICGNKGNHIVEYKGDITLVR